MMAEPPVISMRWPLLLALVLAIVAGVAAPAPGAPPDPGKVEPSAGKPRDDQAVQDDMAQLAGIWTLEAMEVDGHKATDDQMRGWLLVIEGDQYNPGLGQLSVEYTYRVDPSRRPKAIDLIPHEGPYRGRTLRGVYSVHNDRLMICRVRFPEGERPAGFGTRPDSGLASSTWKRRKP